MSVESLNGQALLEILNQQGLNKAYSLESFGFFLDEYVIEGVELTKHETNKRKVEVSGGIISFADNLFRVTGDDFYVSQANKTYYLDFTVKNGFVFNLSHPSDDYLPLWQVNTTVAGLVDTIVDMRGEMGYVRFRSEIAGIIQENLFTDESHVILDFPTAELHSLIVALQTGDSGAAANAARFNSNTGITYNTLKDRLDTEQAEVAEQLTENANQIYTNTLDQRNKVNTRSITRFMTKLKNGIASFAILGDSITDTWAGSFGAGGGASDAAHGYPQVLHALLKSKFGNAIQFTNRGYGGQNTFAASGRFDTEIKPFNYDCVGIALGTNDWNQQNFLVSFESTYRQLIERCINETNADIFLVGLGYFEGWKPEKTIRETDYNAVIQKLAQEYDLCFIDTRAAMLHYMESNLATFADITYAPDPVHPNDLGHSIWADACYDVFNRYSSVFDKPFRDNAQAVHHCLDGDTLFSGTWTTEGPYTSVFRSYIKSTSTIGSFCSLDFLGTDVDIYLACDANRSTDIDIFIDGVLYIDGVTTYSSAFAIKRISIAGLSRGKHTVKIVNNVAVKLSVNYIVTYLKKDENALGSMKNKLGPHDLVINDHFNAFDTNALYLFGEALYVAPTTLSNKYVNTGFLEYFKTCRLIYTKAPAGGIIEVYVDGVLYTTVDTYNASFVRQSEILITLTKLDYHTVIIKMKDKNASSTAYGMYLEGVVFDNEKITRTTGSDGGVFNYNFYAIPNIKLTPTFNGTCYISAVTKKQATVVTSPAAGTYMIEIIGSDIS